MKPTICILLLCTFAQHIAWSQRKGVALGIESGSGVTLLRGEFYDDYGKVTAGFSAGFTVQRYFNRWVSFKSALNYERKASYYETELAFTFPSNVYIHQEEMAHHKQTFDYITIPLMACFHAGKKVQFIAEAGLFMGALARQRNRVWFLQYERSDDMIEKYKRFDIGLVAGAGVAVPLGARCVLSFLIRNNIGLFKIHQEYYAHEAKTFSSTLLAGFSYWLSRKGESDRKLRG